MNKRKLGITVVMFFLLIVYLFLYLGVELDLKYTVEDIGVHFGRLIDASFRITNFTTIQLGIFMILFITNLYLLFSRK